MVGIHVESWIQRFSLANMMMYAVVTRRFWHPLAVHRNPHQDPAEDPYFMIEEVLREKPSSLQHGTDISVHKSP